MRLIGISGLAMSGKDTAAKALIDNKNFVLYKMAFPLKRGLCEILGLGMEYMEDPDLKEQTLDWLGKSPRQMLQTLGTEWGREMVNQNMWTILAQRAWETVQADSTKMGMVIPDIRFNNEVEWLKRNGGELIKVIRPGQRVIGSSGHVSEAGLPDGVIDYFIDNDGTIDELYQKVYNSLNL